MDPKRNIEHELLAAGPTELETSFYVVLYSEYQYEYLYRYVLRDDSAILGWVKWSNCTLATIVVSNLRSGNETH